MKQGVPPSEEKALDIAEKEVYLPLIRWGILGFALVFVLCRYFTDYTAYAMISLMCYLVYGFIAMSIETSEKVHQLERELSMKEILFSSTQGRGTFIAYALMMAGVLILFFKIYAFTEPVKEYWKSGTLQLKVELAAYLISLLTIVLIPLSGYLLSALVRFVITTDGIYVKNSFYPFSDIHHYTIAKSITGPCCLEIVLNDQSELALKLEFYGVKRKKLPEITALLDEKIHQSTGSALMPASEAPGIN